MVLVDTSIWIDLLGRKPRFKVTSEDLTRFVTCAPILQEILQGIRSDQICTQMTHNLLSLIRVADPVPLEDYLLASEIYRLGRKRGFTIRSSIDCLIAAIAIREKLPVWHSDRDFQVIAQYTALKIYDL